MMQRAKKCRKMVWTEELDSALRSMWPQMPGAAVARRMNLHVEKIYCRAARLGLQKYPLRRIYEPPRAAWLEIATRHAIEHGVAPRDVIEGYKGRAVHKARWSAFREMLSAYPESSIAGLARTTGFDRTAIMHGLRRINGATVAEVRRGRASGRLPWRPMERPVEARA